MKTWCLAACLAFVVVPGVARAEDDDARPTATASYAAQTIAMDAGSLLIGGVAQSPALALAGYGLATPIVHFAHKNAIEGLMSLALRTTVPLVLAFAMRAATHDDDSMILGAIAGGIFVSTIDAALLARTF